MSEKTAVLAGATGLVGGYCLKLLLEDADYERVVALVRRPLAEKHPKLVQRLLDFDELRNLDRLPSADVYCALGTTRRKAGSAEAFRRIDLGYPKTLAERALASGARQYLLVSSVGANASSGNLYLRTKGELEEALGAMPFQALHIFRPSLLVGPRRQRRLGEAVAAPIARALRFTLVGPLERYRAVEARAVAAAMIAAAKQGVSGKHVYHWREIQSLAGRDRAVLPATGSQA